MHRFIFLGIIMIPSLIVDFLIFEFGFNWVSSEIFAVNFHDIFDGLLMLISALFKLWILGIMYWYIIYLTISIPYLLIKHKVLELPLADY